MQSTAKKPSKPLKSFYFDNDNCNNDNYVNNDADGNDYNDRIDDNSDYNDKSNDNDDIYNDILRTKCFDIQRIY